MWEAFFTTLNVSKALFPIMYRHCIGCVFVNLHERISYRNLKSLQYTLILRICWCLRNKFQGFSWEYNFNIWNFYFCSQLWESFIPVFAVKSCLSRRGGGLEGEGSLLKLGSVSWIAIIYSLKLHSPLHHHSDHRPINMWSILLIGRMFQNMCTAQFPPGGGDKYRSINHDDWQCHHRSAISVSNHASKHYCLCFTVFNC